MQAFHDTVGGTINEVRDNLANFDDFFRPLRNYFYWEPHCFDIPSCAALRSVFDSLDGISALSDQFAKVTASLDKLNALQPQLVALIPPQIDIQVANRDLLQSNYATTGGTNTQSQEALKNATALGKAFDDAKNDDSFYLPPEAFDNADFKRGLKLFMSPDGKAARMTITHEGTPATPRGHLAHRRPAELRVRRDQGDTAVGCQDLRRRHRVDVQGHPGGGVDVRPADRRDRGDRPDPAHHGVHHPQHGRRGGDRRHRRAVARGLAGPSGPGVAVHLRHRAVLDRARPGDHPAAGGGRRLQPAADIQVQGGDRGGRPEHGHHPGDGGHRRCRHRRRHGVRRHHASFAFSDLVVLGQIGTTIALGLLFDTLIVRSFMTPSIAAMLGRWFWWPLNVRTRPASQMLQPFGSRISVRKLLGPETKDSGSRV